MDLPTPPLPEATAMISLTPSSLSSPLLEKPRKPPYLYTSGNEIEQFPTAANTTTLGFKQWSQREDDGGENLRKEIAIDPSSARRCAILHHEKIFHCREREKVSSSPGTRIFAAFGKHQRSRYNADASVFFNPDTW